ncbi:hypothetical protein V7128_01740 [Neobacillus vireti]|uniref:hypothetical protein n=1 Tax=Neobacillus vireti TaxID=220686 RepID=UPI002FFF7F74
MIPFIVHVRTVEEYSTTVYAHSEEDMKEKVDKITKGLSSLSKNKQRNLSSQKVESGFFRFGFESED